VLVLPLVPWSPDWLALAPLCWPPLVPPMELWPDEVPDWPVALWPDELLSCACTLTELNIAATTDAPSSAFRSLFVFMSIS
jgi:hypothetical protein